MSGSKTEHELCDPSPAKQEDREHDGRHYDETELHALPGHPAQQYPDDHCRGPDCEPGPAQLERRTPGPAADPADCESGDKRPEGDERTERTLAVARPTDQYEGEDEHDVDDRGEDCEHCG